MRRNVKVDALHAKKAEVRRWIRYNDKREEANKAGVTWGTWQKRQESKNG